MDRRRFLEISAVSGLSTLATPPLIAAAKRKVVNDISQLNPVTVADELRPRSTEEIRNALRAWSGPVSVGGGRFSMGGQIAAVDSLHLDMRAMKDVVFFDPKRRLIRVQAGTTWRDIQDVIDPHDLSVKIMQSYSNFTVGGSVSVNCHGRYVGRGPLINSVRAVQLTTSDGEVLELTKSREFELFRAVFGGYGGLGVITEVELELESNARIERIVQDVALANYPDFFRKNVLSDASVIMQNADLRPPNFDVPRSIAWAMTDKPLTETAKLVPRGLDYDLEQNILWAITELPGGDRLREKIDKKHLIQKHSVRWRNREASLDTASLEPRTRSVSTYLLQEYFVPVQNFLPFAKTMARILKARRVNALNVSIRHSPADNISLMTWAPTEVFSFVIYYKQRRHKRDREAAGVWTRELIEAALTNGGRYYLPYRLDATRDQFAKAYPESRDFAALKKRVDPRNQFRNSLWDKYLSL